MKKYKETIWFFAVLIIGVIGLLELAYGWITGDKMMILFGAVMMLLFGGFVQDREIKKLKEELDSRPAYTSINIYNKSEESDFSRRFLGNWPDGSENLKSGDGE